MKIGIFKMQYLLLAISGVLIFTGVIGQASSQRSKLQTTNKIRNPIGTISAKTPIETFSSGIIEEVEISEFSAVLNTKSTPIDSEGDAIVIKQVVDKDTVIYKENKLVSIKELKEGLYIRYAALTPSGAIPKIIYILESPREIITETGTVAKLELKNNEGKLYLTKNNLTFRMNIDSPYTKSPKVISNIIKPKTTLQEQFSTIFKPLKIFRKDISTILNIDKNTVVFKNGESVSINQLETSKKLKYVVPEIITLQYPSNISATVIYVMDQSTQTPNKLKVGSGFVAKIKEGDKDKTKQKGKVSFVYLTKDKRDAQKGLFAYNQILRVGDKTDIFKDGQEVGIEELKVGDLLEFEAPEVYIKIYPVTYVPVKINIRQ